MRQVYFAHPISDYGTTWEAAAETAISLALPGFEIVNPNQPDFDDGYRVRGMQFFLDRCAECDAVVWSPFPNGLVGAGVAKEVASFAVSGAAMMLGRDLRLVYGWPAAALILSVEQTRALIAHYRVTAAQ